MHISITSSKLLTIKQRLPSQFKALSLSLTSHQTLVIQSFISLIHLQIGYLPIFSCLSFSLFKLIPMAALLLLVLLLAISGGSDAAWCVCKSDQNNNALQKTLDYACGAGADCSPILQNGACYNPNTVAAHCSYAANSFYQRKGQVQGSCDFSGTATLTNSDPGGNGCTYPATTSAAGTSSTPTSTNTPSSSTTTSTTTPSGNGGLLGLGPSGSSSMDGSDGGLLPKAKMGSLLTILLSVLALLRF